jgi:hypothetical protein
MVSGQDRVSVNHESECMSSNVNQRVSDKFESNDNTDEDPSREKR